MKFTRIEAGIYTAQNGMSIKRELRNGSHRWLVYNEQGAMLVIMCSLKEAKEWIEDAEREQAQLEEARKELQSSLSAHLKALDDEKKARTAQAEEKPAPDKKYSVLRYNKNTGKEESMGIWLGDGMQNFKKGSGFCAGLFYTEDVEWLYYAQEEPEKEIAQAEDEITAEPDQETAQENNLEAQRASGLEGKRVIIKKDADIIGKSWIVPDMLQFIGKEARIKMSDSYNTVWLTGIDGIDGYCWALDALEILPDETADQAELSMLEIANVNNLTEFYDAKTDSIRFPDGTFENTEIFVFRMMRENPDLIIRMFNGWIHLEKKSQPEKAQEELQSSDDEITQETSADATEGKSEPQRASSGKKSSNEISREMIDAYNRLCDSLKGTDHYYLLHLYHEYKDVDGRFQQLGWGGIREHMCKYADERFFIKKIKGACWLYYDWRGDQERWLLNDYAKAYFIGEEA